MRRWFLAVLIVCGGAEQIHAQTGLNSSSNPSFIGQPVTFTAMVSGLTNNMLPTGMRSTNEDFWETKTHTDERKRNR
jgi:hypothetical protein